MVDEMMRSQMKIYHLTHQLTISSTIPSLMSSLIYHLIYHLIHHLNLIVVDLLLIFVLYQLLVGLLVIEMVDEMVDHNFDIIFFLSFSHNLTILQSLIFISFSSSFKKTNKQQLGISFQIFCLIFLKISKKIMNKYYIWWERDERWWDWWLMILFSHNLPSSINQ